MPRRGLVPLSLVGMVARRSIRNELFGMTFLPSFLLDLGTYTGRYRFIVL